ncbi:MAG: diguanylate cyclase, partial [Actinomycetota bacterium]|nr:diguanylate cyclase [Actinomycetota bacterium]
MRNVMHALTVAPKRAASRLRAGPVWAEGMLPARTLRKLLVARCFVGVLMAFLLVVVLNVYLSRSVERSFSDLALLSAVLLAGINMSLAAASATGRLRIAWGGLASAAFFWALGQAVWSWYELVMHTETPFPGAADVGYLGFPLGAVIGLAVFPANVSHGGRRRLLLDGLMSASAIGLVSRATDLSTIKDASQSLLDRWVAVAYPLSDIALLVVCVLVLSRSRAHRIPLVFVAGGLMLMALADSAYLLAPDSNATGSPIDLGWFFAFGALAFAPLTPSATETISVSKAPTVAGTLLPYVPLSGAVGFMCWQFVAGHPISSTETFLAAVIVLLVLFRQFLTVQDNQQLARTLAEREAELRHQAFHDPLTGLANRALFVDRVEHALELHRRDRRPLAICFLDLDGFKGVNDTLGHSAGDRLLMEVSLRFHAQLSD